MADLPGKRVRLPGPATSSQRLAIRIQTSAADELVALDPTSSDPRTDDLAVPVLDADDELADEIRLALTDLTVRAGKPDPVLTEALTDNVGRALSSVARSRR